MITDLFKEQEYYKKVLYHSYSSLTRLLYSPQLYYKHYILGQREETLQPSLIEGKAIHCLLLENDKFGDMFTLSPGKIPEGNAKLIIDRTLGHYLFSMEEPVPETLEACEEVIIDILKDINLHQALKTDKQRLEKVLTDQNTSYWTFLKTKGNKIVIDQETYDKCSESVEIIKAHKEISKLLCLEGWDMQVGLDTFNEKELSIQTEGYPFGFKGILDNYVIDKKNKTVKINDLKTTSKSLHEFRDSVEYYRYDIQAVIQKMLVINSYPVQDYDLVFNFIVIDKYQQVYAFEVSKGTMSKWEEGLQEVLQAAVWHYQSKRYDLPYEFSKKVIL